MPTNSIINDDQQQLDSTGASIPTTVCGNSDVGSLRGNLPMPGVGGVESSLSRLSLSATFKRNLPPRYAKLLQAKELQEKEALKSRYGHQTQKEVSFCVHKITVNITWWISNRQFETINKGYTKSMFSIGQRSPTGYVNSFEATLWDLKLW